MNLLKIAVLSALTISAALAQTLTPQGRLTPQSNTPVVTQDNTSISSVYYTPYVGNTLPLPNGSGGYTNSTFSQLTLTFGTANVNANIYDIFAYSNSGTWVICTGPTWGPSGSPSLTSRGSGSGTTEITQVGGVWVNAQSMTCKNNINNYSVAANAGVYLGSVYMTGNGSTDMRLKPAAVGNGTNNVLGLYNAYNRVRLTAYCRDSTSGWLYSTASWRAANNSADNRILFLDGLQQSPPTGNYSVMGSTTTNAVGAYIGLNEDSSTTTPNISSLMASAPSQSSVNQYSVTETFFPLLGFHYIYAVEYASGFEADWFGSNASQQLMALTVSLDM